MTNILRVSAPVRLDFAGAWTDVAPFADETRGVVVNAAIDLRSRVELEVDQDRYRLRADDLDEDVDVATIGELATDGKLQLLKAAIRRSQIAPCSLRTSADAPPGSGLGTSGALSVALAFAMAKAQGRSRSALEIAHDAWQLETVDAAVPGGQQDQYAAALGGFQYLAFDGGRTSARPLSIEPAFAQALAQHIVICYTGRSRFSGDTITRVMNAYKVREASVVDALHSLVDIAEEMASALESSDLALTGRLLAKNWAAQQRLAPGMCPDELAHLERAMFAAGAIGGKAAGAGAGGSMFFVVPGNVAAAIDAARATGAVILPTRWTDRGVRDE